MALADLFRAIEDDAAAERADVERQAAAAATSILEQARHEADTLHTELVTAAEMEATAEAERDLARARLAASAAVRDARESAFQALLAGVQAGVSTVRGSDAYPRLFRALVAQSRAALPDARELHVDPRDLELAKAIAGDLHIAATLDTCGGVELSGADRRTVRNTVEVRLTNAEPLLRAQFMRWLASAPGTDPAVDG
jgi:vacuolar-type H+-ATPase subunit E/Vma4